MNPHGSAKTCPFSRRILVRQGVDLYLGRAVSAGLQGVSFTGGYRRYAMWKGTHPVPFACESPM